MLTEIRHRIDHAEPLTRADASWLFHEASDETLKELSGIVRARYHDPTVATYLIMAIVNYTNVCVAKCDYCSFYRLPGQEGAYLLSYEDVCEKIDALVEHGGTLIGFNGGFHPKLRVSDYATFFSRIHARYGGTLAFYEMTIAEFMFYCKVSKISYDQGARIFAENGTRWITGGGAEILDDDFRRRHSPLKYKVEDYYDAQRAVINAGMGTTATMVIGFDETLDERLNHLFRLRAFQEDTGGITSFLCWTYKPWNNDLGGDEVPTRDYLRWLAICRLVLDNIRHIRTSVLTKNEDALLGLLYGANDFDLPTEDEVTETAGATISTDFEKILNTAREMGITPVHRAPFPIPQPVRPVEEQRETVRPASP